MKSQPLNSLRQILCEFTDATFPWLGDLTPVKAIWCFREEPVLVNYTQFQKISSNLKKYGNYYERARQIKGNHLHFERETENYYHVKSFHQKMHHLCFLWGESQEEFIQERSLSEHALKLNITTMSLHINMSINGWKPFILAIFP